MSNLIKDQFFNAEHEFNEEITHVLNKTIGKKMRETQKQQIIYSIMSLAEDNDNELLEIENEIKNKQRPTNISYLQNNFPIINIFYVNLPPNAYYSPYYSNFQQSTINMIPQNPNFLPQKPQLLHPPPQFAQQPNYGLSNQQIQQSSQNPSQFTVKKKKSKEKISYKKSHKHDKKEKKKMKDDKKYEVQTFQFQPGNLFNGIIKHLTDITGGNIHRNGTIELTCEEKTSSDQPPENILDNNSKCFGARSGSQNYCIKFDFKSRLIEITGYAIKSYSFSSGHMKSWVLEMSKDGDKWEQIDQRQDDSSLNGSSRKSEFKIANPKGFSRYVRIRQTGEFWGYQSFISPGFSQIEFYGRLKTPK